MIELVVALVASTVLVAGLGSVMLIARQVAYTPSSATRSTQATDAIHQMSEELRYASHVLQQTSRLVEFVVADRYADGAAEKIRYEWSGVAGEPLYRSVNGTASAILQNIQDCTFTFDTLATATSPITRTSYVRAMAKLRSGEQGHSRIDAAIPLAARPEKLTAYWRTDFDSNPTAIDINGDGAADWAASNGATFLAGAGAGQLTAGTWYANGDLATTPANNFTTNTVIDLACKNMAATGASAEILRVIADSVGASYAVIIVRLTKQTDGSQTLTLVGKPTSGTETTLKTVDNLVDDYLRVRLTIQPDTNRVSLQVNEVGDDVLGGPFIYPTHSPTLPDRNVKIGGGGAKFDYVEVRVLSAT